MGYLSFKSYSSFRLWAFAWCHVKWQVCLTLYSGRKIRRDTGSKSCFYILFFSVVTSWIQDPYCLSPVLSHGLPTAFHWILAVDSCWIKNINSSCSLCLWICSCLSVIQVLLAISSPREHSLIESMLSISFLTITKVSLSSVSWEACLWPLSMRHHLPWTKHRCLQKL